MWSEIMYFQYPYLRKFVLLAVIAAVAAVAAIACGGSADEEQPYQRVIARDSVLTIADFEAVGFNIESLHKGEESTNAFAAQIHRIDSVQLEDIHAVIMDLFKISRKHGGEYDGWETSVERERDDEEQ